MYIYVDVDSIANNKNISCDSYKTTNALEWVSFGTDEDAKFLAQTKLCWNLVSLNSWSRSHIPFSDFHSLFLPPSFSAIYPISDMMNILHTCSVIDFQDWLEMRKNGKMKTFSNLECLYHRKRSLHISIKFGRESTTTPTLAICVWIVEMEK